MHQDWAWFNWKSGKNLLKHGGKEEAEGITQDRVIVKQARIGCFKDSWFY
jgi:hypothetical protein